MSGIGWTFFWVICVIALLALAFWPARVARRSLAGSSA
jgi:hypothetical protein